MNDKHILDNAPDGATDYVNGIQFCYRKASEDDYFLWSGKDWVKSNVIYFYTRSLADIKALVEKDKVISEQAAKIAEFKTSTVALIANAQKQLADEAKKYISLSNAYAAGELSESGEGSVYCEKIYVENRIKDILNPFMRL